MSGVIQKYHVSKNLFDETYPDINVNIHEVIIHVPNGEYTLSTTTPLNNNGYANLFISQGTEAPVTSVNGVWNEQSRTIAVTNGELKISYRNIDGVTPINYNTMLNKGSTALPYEPFETENLWNASVEQGAINSTTGAETSNNERIRSTSIALSQGTYTISASGSAQDVFIYLYGTDDTYIGIYDSSWARMPTSITLSANCKVRFVFKKYSGTVVPSDISDIMLNVGSTALPYTPYGTIWKDIPYTRLETATDTITALPKTIYTDTTSIPSANLLNTTDTQQSFPAGTYYIYSDSMGANISYYDDIGEEYPTIYGIANDGATFTATTSLVVSVSSADKLPLCMVAKSSEAVPFTPYTGDYTIKGNMQQSGTPTPSNPVDVNGVGVRTENLFDINDLEQGSIDQNNGSNIDSSDVQRTHSYISVSPNTTYIISNINGAVRMHEYSDSGYIGSTVISSDFTTSDSCSKIRFNGLTGNFLQNTMLNTGLTAKSYEPYGYKIPISSGGVTTNIYLGSTQTVRQIKKVVLTGNESDWTMGTSQFGKRFGYALTSAMESTIDMVRSVCSHVPLTYSGSTYINPNTYTIGSNQVFNISLDASYTTLDQFLDWLKAQYAAGTPVTVWYVLATPTTDIVNEPLMKIGDYADTLSNATAIPTTSGGQTFDVDTTLKPSEVDLTYHGWHEHQPKKKSRNLFDKDNDIEKFYVRVSDGTYKSSAGNSYSAIIPCVAGTAYTITTISKTLRVGFYATKPVDGTSCIESFNNNNSSYTSRSVTYTASTNATYMAIYAYQDGDEYSDGKTLEDIYGVLMLNAGETALPYEPYWE